MRHDHVLAVFNRGKVGKNVLGRLDVDRIALSADEQTNWMPRTLGPMSLRPGLEYLGTTPDDGAYLPFIYDTSDNALLEMTPGKMRVWDMGDTLISRTSVATTITNGGFVNDLTGWIDADEGAVAASTWAGALQLIGTGDEAAIRRQQLTVAGGETGVEHSARIVVTRGPVLFRVGTTAGDDDVYPQAVLRTGTHSLTFTPGSTTIWIEFATTIQYPCLVDSIAFETSGTLELPTPYATADDCKAIRWDQSGDVVFCAADGIRPQRIERRESNSWSIVDYDADDGPFLGANTENITLTSNGLTGAVTITASQPVFEAGHVGSVWQHTSIGQTVTDALSAANTFSDPIRVTGTGTGRQFQIDVTGTWVATVTLQRSVGDVGNWTDVESYTVNTSKTFNDGFDNSDIYYRIGIKTGDYTSGTVNIDLGYPSGSIVGAFRIIGYTSATVVSAVVLKALGGTDPTTFWAEGAWSDVQGWPTAVGFYQGRLWWAGNGRLYGSVSDDFTSYDPNFEGDAGPINRSVGDGPVNQVNWLLPMERLLAGTDTREQSIRSNSFDEPITPSNYNSKATSTKGSARIPATFSGATGFFVGKNTTDLYELRWASDEYAYRPAKMTLLVPELAETGDPATTGILRVAHQEEPDVRVHCVKADGGASVLVRDAAEDVLAWVDIETDGVVEDVCVLPGVVEDRVFYRVRRTINGSEVRYHEEWAREDQCRGGTVNRQADSFIIGSESPATATLTGLDHLEGETVVVWADGKDHGTFTVASGQITLGETVTDWVAGLAYEARYKSAKMAVRTDMGLDIVRRKRAAQIGFLLADTHYQGLQYGPDFTTLDDLPLIEDEIATTADTVWEAYDQDTTAFPGEWDTDARICLRAAAPRPCTVMAALINFDRQNS